MREQEIKAMIRALREVMARRRFSMQGLAHVLGLSASHLSMIFSGKRQPGVHFIRAVLEHFPEIRQEIGDSLSDRGDQNSESEHKLS